MFSQETFATEGRARQRCRVLLVEDERISRRALSALLSASGYETEAFATAEDALRLLPEDNLPPVALVDLNLPGMNGLDLIQELEQLDPDVFPILITAQGGERLETLLRDRDVAYLRKPINFDRLLSLLSKCERPN